ncbi:MAG: IS6 family transposase, partial [Saccharolobus sp.]
MGDTTGTRWRVPVLTQVILVLMEYINLKPRFYTSEVIASALA